jgi:hypothetical protein
MPKLKYQTKEMRETNCNIVCTVEKVAGMAHEGVAMVAKVGSVVHFLSENVGNVGFAADMFDGDHAISNPFASGILPILNVAIAFGGHVATPFEKGAVVVVQDGGMGGIINWIAQGREVFDHVASVDHQS